MKFPEENTEVHCKHSVSEFYVMMWYQQSLNNTSMKLIAHLYFKQATVENSFSSHFNVSGDGEKHSTLHLIKLTEAEHSAVYYCAASRAQCSRSLHSATKTFPFIDIIGSNHILKLAVTFNGVKHLQNKFIPIINYAIKAICSQIPV